jgi:very-short-patch-repair endonuclease
LWAAKLAAPSGAAFTAHTGAYLLDLSPNPGNLIEMVTVRGRPQPQDDLRVRRTRRLPSHELARSGPFLHTTGPRVLLDLAPRVSGHKLDALLDRTFALRTFQQTSFERILREHPSARGRHALVAALDRVTANAGRYRSDFELRMDHELHDRQISTDHLINARVHGLEVDVSWLGARAILELDSTEFHQTPAQLAKDAAKRRTLEALGFVFLRVHRSQYDYETDRTMARIDAFLLANREAPVPPLRRRRAA